MLFSYTAKNSKGEVYSGEHDAKSKIDLYSIIRDEGGRILTVREKKQNKVLGSFKTILSGVNTHDKIIFAKNLGSMLSAGLSMTRALDVMEKQTKKAALSELLHSLNEDVSKGSPLSDALRKKASVFPAIFVSMVKAGEESGNLSDSLGVVALQMDKSYTLSKRIKGAMIYPAVILSLMVAIAILLLIYMVPTLTATFSGLGIELPLSTRIIIGASDFLIEHTVIFFGVVIGIIALGLAFFRSEIGKKLVDNIMVRLPVIGEITKEIYSARTARTLSSLLSSGVPIVTALESTEDVLSNYLYKKAINEAKGAIQKGETVSAVLSRYEHIYPPFIVEMMSVGEETGKSAQMLLNVATYYEDDVDEKTKNLSTIVEPIMMIVIGAGVGVFALSMLAPTYSLVDTI